MASFEATSIGSQDPALQSTLDEIEKELESKYRLSTIHQGEAVYLVQRETDDGFRIDFSNETSINLDKDVFSQDLTVQINRLFESLSEPRVLKIREQFSTPQQSPNASQNETTTQEFVSLKEFRDFVKKVEEYQRILLNEVRGVGDVVKQSIEQQQQLESDSSNFQRIRQFENSQTPQQNENQTISQFPTTKGFGSKDKSTCKSALLADTILRESIAEQREQWKKRQANNQETGSDDWDTPRRDNENFEDRQQNNQQRVLPFQKGFRQSSQQNFLPSDSQSDSRNQRPDDTMNPLTIRDRCAKCGLIGHWSTDCKNQDSCHYKPFYHLAPNRNPDATKRDWNKRHVEDDGNFASKRSRMADTMPKQMDSRDYGPRPLFAPRGVDNFQPRGYMYEEPEVTRYRDTNEYTDRYNPDRFAEHQQQYNYPTGQYGQRYNGVWNR